MWGLQHRKLKKWKAFCVHNTVCISFYQPPCVRRGACGSSQGAGGTWGQHLHWEQGGEDPSPGSQGRSGQHPSSDCGGMIPWLIYGWCSNSNPHHRKLHNENSHPSLVWHIQMCNRWKMRVCPGEKLDCTALLSALQMGQWNCSDVRCLVKTLLCTKCGLFNTAVYFLMIYSFLCLNCCKNDQIKISVQPVSKLYLGCIYLLYIQALDPANVVVHHSFEVVFSGQLLKEISKLKIVFRAFSLKTATLFVHTSHSYSVV